MSGRERFALVCAAVVTVPAALVVVAGIVVLFSMGGWAAVAAVGLCVMVLACAGMLWGLTA